MDELLRIENLAVEYQSERAVAKALNGINLTIGKGESLGLVGETGAGKTTIALSTLRLLPKRASRIVDGDIIYKNKSVFEMSKKELISFRGNDVSMIFQNPLTALNPVFTVGEQIAMVLRSHKGLSKNDALLRAGELLEQVGIPKYRLNDYPMQLSGGMRQRVGIAASLACNPELLIADEPTTALDVTIQAQILELMRGLQETYNSSLLMITHNLGIISELCQKTAVIYAGRIIEYGPTEEVFAHPAHPYTVGLLKSLPSLEGKRERLLNIPGSVASAQDLPEGCCFHPRCSHCTEECKHCVPKMKHVNGSHTVACFHSGGGMNK